MQARTPVFFHSHADPWACAVPRDARPPSSQAAVRLSRVRPHPPTASADGPDLFLRPSRRSHGRPCPVQPWSAPLRDRTCRRRPPVAAVHDGGGRSRDKPLADRHADQPSGLMPGRRSRSGRGGEAGCSALASDTSVPEAALGGGHRLAHLAQALGRHGALARRAVPQLDRGQHPQPLHAMEPRALMFAHLAWRHLSPPALTHALTLSPRSSPASAKRAEPSSVGVPAGLRRPARFAFVTTHHFAIRPGPLLRATGRGLGRWVDGPSGRAHAARFLKDRPHNGSPSADGHSISVQARRTGRPLPRDRGVLARTGAPQAGGNGSPPCLRANCPCDGAVVPRWRGLIGTPLV